MKILHTADWHLGKTLHKYSLEEDNALFLTWLMDEIRARKIEVLLVSGDIFDTANPKNSVLTLYYNFLKELIPLHCHVVITGGNHDAPTLLNAPKEILNLLNIDVIGEATAQIEDELITLKNKTGDPTLQIAAVPYLRDSDIRKAVAGNSYENQLRQISEGIKTHYEAISALLNPEVPSIAMGHLYVQGVSTSESEREVHAIGGVAAFTSDNFPKAFDYIALGHIHKPQRIADSDYIRYCGSPISLSFSERKDQKYVIELTLEGGKLRTPELVEVPKFRELKRIQGNINDVWKTLETYQSPCQLPSLLEILVQEEAYSPEHTVQFNLLTQEFADRNFQIVISKLTYAHQISGIAQLYTVGESIGTLTAKEVFQKRLDNEKIDPETQHELNVAFEELLRELLETTND